MNKVENTNIYTSIKDQANLPRYFRRIFKILLNLKVGSIEVKLPDERIFKVYGENNGIDARVDIIDPDCFARLVSWPVKWLRVGYQCVQQRPWLKKRLRENKPQLKLQDRRV